MNVAVNRPKKYSVLEELVRIGEMKLAIWPAARFLPRFMSAGIVNALTFVLLLLPSTGLRTYWQTRYLFGYSRRHSLRLTFERLRLHLFSYLMTLRIIFDREHPRMWRVTHINRENLDKVIASDRSFIIATAHFNRFVLHSTNSQANLPAHGVHIAVPLREHRGVIRSLFARADGMRLAERLHNMRLAMFFAAFHDSAPHDTSDPPSICYVGKGRGAAVEILQFLKQPGNAIFNNVDAPWKRRGPGAYERPFAGYGNKLFSTGTARLAEKTGCPILPLVYWYNTETHSHVLEWGTPVFEVDDPERVMDALIDRVEIAIGKRPGQYSLDIGNLRHWNPDTERWE